MQFGKNQTRQKIRSEQEMKESEESLEETLKASPDRNRHKQKNDRRNDNRKDHRNDRRNDNRNDNRNNSSPQREGQRREEGTETRGFFHRNDKKPQQKPQPKIKLKPIRVIPLGGIGEIGKNMTLVAYGEDMVIIDCGMGFPDEDMPGVDLVIPDFTFVEQNKDHIKGVLLTHGHEDHIGSIPYLLRTLNVPIYGTALTLGIIEKKLEEFVLPYAPKLRCVKPGDIIPCGEMKAEFIHVNHSIADACAIALHTPRGVVLHTGDFKLDTTPIDGGMMDLARLGELGKEGVTLLLEESTNAERPGYTPSEKKVGAAMEDIFLTHTGKRLIIATFSSNVHRVQQIIDISARNHRKVAITGRSMSNIVDVAQKLGYMKVPAGVLVDIESIKRYRPKELTIVTTGSQGEPMSALRRMAYKEHPYVKMEPTDCVVLSASAIPGNEKLVGNVINEMSLMGVEVLSDAVVSVHVSGHACQEELKMVQCLTRPKYFMPVHGEARHLYANRNLALSVGMKPENIFLSEIGKPLIIDDNGAKFGDMVPAGRVLVDGFGVGDVENMVLRDRKRLAEDGLVMIAVTVDTREGILISGPEVLSRGFVLVKESESMMNSIKDVAQKVLAKSVRRSKFVDRGQIRKNLQNEVGDYIAEQTGRKPMILPVLMEI